MNSTLACVLDDLDQVDPDLARFLSELDFDLELSGFDQWCDSEEVLLNGEGHDNNDDSGELKHGGKTTIAQRMRKAGFTAVDLLREDDLARAQALYDKVTSDHIHKERKRPRLKDGIPRIMRNDIRWTYAQMFMNTVNSGDFAKMQSFFQTFMTKPCKFIVDHEINPEFGIPHRLLVNGPKLMAHYLLGVFVIFPDMVLKMTDSKIISSRGWTGSKIVIEIELHSTKLFDISLDAWLPQVKYLAKFKERHNTTGFKPDHVTEPNSTSVSSSVSASSTVLSAADVEAESSAGASELKIDQILDISESTDYLAAANTEIARKGYRYMNEIKKANEEHLQKKRRFNALTEAVAASGASSTNRTSINTDTALITSTNINSSYACDSEQSDHKATCGTSSCGAVEGWGWAKLAVQGIMSATGSCSTGSSARASGTSTSAASPSAAASSTATAVATAPTTTTTATATAMIGHNYQPGKLIQALFASAKLRDKPKILKAKGVITIFLDASNNMQHLNLVLAQNDGDKL